MKQWNTSDRLFLDEFYDNSVSIRQKEVACWEVERREEESCQKEVERRREEAHKEAECQKEVERRQNDLEEHHNHSKKRRKGRLRKLTISIPPLTAGSCSATAQKRVPFIYILFINPNRDWSENFRRCTTFKMTQTLKLGVTKRLWTFQRSRCRVSASQHQESVNVFQGVLPVLLTFLCSIFV